MKSTLSPPRLRRVVLHALASGALLTLGVSGALAAEPSAPAPHELGWLCVPVSDTRISQVAAFNRDARMLSVTVTRERFYIEATGPGNAGRVCVPTIVKMGDADVPDATLIFERTLHVGKVSRSSQAEIVLTPEDPRLDEVTLSIVGLADQWTERDGTATFSVVTPVSFPPRTVRGFLGDGDGGLPSRVFVTAAAAQRFEERCAPAELKATAVANYATYDERSGRVVARGVEPLRLEVGLKLSRCEGLALDTLMVAVAVPVSDENDPYAVAWYVLPRQAEMKLADPADPESGRAGTRYRHEDPLGGYHVCRQPTWTSALLEDVPLVGKWELDQGEWSELTASTTFAPRLLRGTAVTLVDERQSWALIRVVAEGRPRVLAIPSRFVALPSGPASEVTELGKGLCPIPRGVWRGTSSTTQAFRVTQDNPGAELAGLWFEIPSGSYVLQLCQNTATRETCRGPRELACDPVYVGGAQGGPGERFVMVRYAGSFLAVRDRDLRDRTTGAFTIRRDRPWYWAADPDTKRDVRSPWVFGLGPGARLSFVRHQDFGWNIRARVQKLTEDSLGFEGGFGVGGDGAGVFLELVGGAQALVHRFTEIPVELRLGLLGKLDLRASAAGGLGFDVIGKAQFRWVNDIAPVSFEVGINLGYGGTFGAEGRGGVTFGIPIMVNVELVDF